jgi:tetratricopeptide (TPR) repeat protein
MIRTIVCLLLAPFLLVSCASTRANDVAQQAASLYAQGESASALALYEKAVEIEPEKSEYRYNYLLSLLDVDPAAVPAQAEQAFAEFPAHLQFLLVKARSYALQNDYEQALVTYDRILDLDVLNYDLMASVMQLAKSWGYRENALALAEYLLLHHVKEQEAAALIEELAPKDSYLRDIAAYLRKEAETSDQQQSQQESK